MTNRKNSISTIDRRKFLATVTASSGLAFAGCIGDEDDDGEDFPSSDSSELGEQVQGAPFEVMSGLPAATQMEQAANHISSVLEEDLGVSSDVTVKEFLTFQEETFNDNRSQNFHLDYHPPFPAFLDPNRLLTGYDLSSAGANGQGNVAQYANCEHALLVQEQSKILDEEDRRETVHQALSVASNDVERINLLGQAFRGAYRSDQIEIPEIGEGGISDFNVELMWEATPTEGDDKIMNITPGNLDGVAYQASSYVELWSHCVYSSLVYYDKNLNIQPSLATDWDVSGDGTEITFTLRDDAMFHDGTPITAEDVRWTYQWIEDNYEVLALAESWPYDSIEAIDEQTVEFTFTDPVGPFLWAHVPMWGILPSEIWIDAGAEENPTNPDIDTDEIIGSGPYQVENFQQEDILDLAPFDDHWVDVEGNMVFRAFHDMEGARRAFIEGEINILHDFDGATAEIIADEVGESAEIDQRSSFMDWWLIPQNNFGPTKFREFRLAVSHAIDRSLLNEQLEHGQSEPHLYSSLFGSTHPFYPDDPDTVLTQIAESAAPNPERAREILADAGWGWDEDGNLHYPQDADLDPLWPEGSEPLEQPETFPCVEEL